MSQNVVDGSIDFSMGQNSSLNPDKIDPRSYFLGVNTIANRGDVGPRWGWRQIDLRFPEGGVTLPNNIVKSYEAIFKSGRFQGATYYNIGEEKYFIVVVSGIIYLINRRTRQIIILELADESYINENASRVDITVAEKYVVIHDWPNYPVIIDGLEARRADPDEDEVPVSVLSSYNQNRLIISNAGSEFTAGDPVGSLAAPNAPITFQEFLVSGTEFTGQIFQLPTEYSNQPITGMTFLPITDTSTGVGPLLVSTESRIFTYSTQQPRETWEAGQFGTLLIGNSGFAGPRAFTSVNSDIFYISGDGQVRTVAMSRNEFNQWASVPISNEVARWIKFWDKDLVYFSSVAYFNNRVFFTVNPFRTPVSTIRGLSVSDYAHGGMVVLSLDNISAFGQAGTPAWDGLWTGIYPTQLLSDDVSLYAFAKNNQRINALYECTPDESVDVVDGRERDVRSVLVTREYSFEAPLQNKKIRNIDLALEDVAGDFEIQVEWKPAQASLFLKWRKFCHKTIWNTVKVPTLAQVSGFASHSFRELNLGTPNEHECSPITDDYYTSFRRIQFRLTMKGRSWSIRALKIMGTIDMENETESVCMVDGECPFPVKEILNDVFKYWAEGEVDLCQED